MKLKEIASYIDELLEVVKIEGPGAKGLQVENGGNVDEIYLCVDVSCEVINRCSPESLIVAQHGVMFSQPVSITGINYNILQNLIKRDCALYTAHRALEYHKEYGSSRGFYKLCKWDVYEKEPFGSGDGKNFLSSIVEFPEERDFGEIMEELREIFGKDLLVWDFGKKKIKKTVFMAGAGIIGKMGGNERFYEGLDKGIDLFISGERFSHFYWKAKDNNTNMVFVGHYNSEKTGIKLLGEHLGEKFKLLHTFVDLPTGL